MEDNIFFHVILFLYVQSLGRYCMFLHVNVSDLISSLVFYNKPRVSHLTTSYIVFFGTCWTLHWGSEQQHDVWQMLHIWFLFLEIINMLITLSLYKTLRVNCPCASLVIHIEFTLWCVTHLVVLVPLRGMSPSMHQVPPCSSRKALRNGGSVLGISSII